MKIVLTTMSGTLEGELDQRFGRAAGFLVYDTEKKSYDFVDNSQNLNAVQGAGIQAAQNMIATGASCLITGNCGPKAFKVLQSAGVKIYSCNAQLLKQCIKQFEDGELTEVTGATVDAHWS